MKTHAALKMYFDRKKKASPGFSMRSLARRLDVSASFLSRVLSGKKAIPPELLKKLAHALDVEPELLVSPTARTSKKAPEVNTAIDDWGMADMRATQVLRNWYNVPIVVLATLENFDGRPESIARRLGLSKTTTEIALRELVSLDLLREVDGLYEKTENKLRITSSKSISVIRKFHDEMLEKSQQALRNAGDENEFQKRLITGITVSANPEKIQEAKGRLAEFLHELANDLIASPGTEVYHLAAQLFPLTKD
jgi:uncharacterized protein (TIGR02147 family)